MTMMECVEKSSKSYLVSLLLLSLPLTVAITFPNLFCVAPGWTYLRDSLLVMRQSSINHGSYEIPHLFKLF
jgi:hypothetical protein